MFCPSQSLAVARFSSALPVRSSRPVASRPVLCCPPLQTGGGGLLMMLRCSLVFSLLFLHSLFFSLSLFLSFSPSHLSLPFPPSLPSPPFPPHPCLTSLQLSPLPHPSSPRLSPPQTTTIQRPPSHPQTTHARHPRPLASSHPSTPTTTSAPPSQSHPVLQRPSPPSSSYSLPVHHPDAASSALGREATRLGMDISSAEKQPSFVRVGVSQAMYSPMTWECSR